MVMSQQLFTGKVAFSVTESQYYLAFPTYGLFPCLLAEIVHCAMTHAIAASWATVAVALTRLLPQRLVPSVLGRV
jgi:hypothetical protein